MLVNGVGYRIDITDLECTYEKEIELYIYICKEIPWPSMDLKAWRRALLYSGFGIGRKAAHNILSSISYERFMDAVITENISV